MARTNRTFAAVLGTGALVLALAACNDSKPAARSASTVESSSTSSQAPTQSPSEPSANGSKPSGNVAAFLARMRHGIGDKGSAHVQVTMKGPVSSTAEGDSAYGPGGDQMRLTMRLPQLRNAQIQMIVVDGTTYMAMPGVTPVGKFFKLPAADSKLAGVTGGAGGLSPADSFAGIEAGLRAVKALGSERIDGKPYDHFRLRVDAAASMAALGAGDVPGLPKNLDYDVWLDGNDQLRRVRYEVGGTQLTMELTDWGKPFAVSAPPKKDLVAPPRGL